MTFDPVPRIKGQGTRQWNLSESHANDQFYGIDELRDVIATLAPEALDVLEVAISDLTTALLDYHAECRARRPQRGASGDIGARVATFPTAPRSTTQLAQNS
jgi:hypothetical protein